MKQCTALSLHLLSDRSDCCVIQALVVQVLGRNFSVRTWTYRCSAAQGRHNAEANVLVFSLRDGTRTSDDAGLLLRSLPLP